MTLITTEATIETLITRLERAEAEREALRAEVARLRECYADRDRSLEFEYNARMAAEAQADAWREAATFYADHDAACQITPGSPDTCTCGYSRAIGTAMAADRIGPTEPTPYAREVAVGRATLAAARAEAAYMTHIAATGCDDLATAQALRAAWCDANRARRAAVEAALREEALQ